MNKFPMGSAEFATKIIEKWYNYSTHELSMKFPTIDQLKISSLFSKTKILAEFLENNSKEEVSEICSAILKVFENHKDPELLIKWTVYRSYSKSNKKIGGAYKIFYNLFKAVENKTSKDCSLSIQKICTEINNRFNEILKNESNEVEDSESYEILDNESKSLAIVGFDRDEKGNILIPVPENKNLSDK